MGVLDPGLCTLDPPPSPHSTLAEIFKGARGGLGYQNVLFLLVRSPCKISEPYNNPFCGFEQLGKNNNKSGKIPKIVATFVSASSRTHSARTNLPNRTYLEGVGGFYICKTKILWIKSAPFRPYPIFAIDDPAKSHKQNNQYQLMLVSCFWCLRTLATVTCCKLLQSQLKTMHNPVHSKSLLIQNTKDFQN